MSRIMPALFLCCLISVQATWAQDQPETNTERLSIHQSPAAIEVRQQGQLVLRYNVKSPPAPTGIASVYERSGCLHPVLSPGGREVTGMFSPDHPHQQGVFSAWVRTRYDGREVDFWNLAGGTGRVLHERTISLFRRDETVGFVVDLLHRATAAPAVDVLRERWTVTAHQTDDNFHCLDLHTLQTAITDKPLFVNKYHYGGVAIRGPVAWLSPGDPDSPAAKAPAAQSGFLNSLGSDRGKGNHEHVRWVAMWGRSGDGITTVAVLSHPGNFRAPQAARLHPTKPYFCFAPCVDDSFVIDRARPYEARYRYLVTDAMPDTAWLDRQYQAWIAAAP